MKKGKLIELLLILVGLVLIGVSVFMLVKNNTNNNKKEETNYKIEDDKYVNDSDELNKEKTFEGLLIEETEFSFDTKLDNTDISFKVTNKNNVKYEGKNVLLSFVDKEGMVLSTMFAYIPELEPNQSEKVYGSISGNIVDAYDMKIKAME